ncbi:hypothetical protein AN639_11780 [Candidatus Epulonipiscium fishelsonii]|uniref:Uncharacterized protein n=1 Tax=Candidatus Epulonipiscium fishelsonii TaxID=77094 RepID=A0ACC8XEX7_9FIRM|nr:hypothetical protein AN396_03025 [Epulopiscium sp. SCG-B11WGA-EpuloA1]ONI42916.1 hypothetical protein AN639_11780 [Epulopiscium sp. SCG-B05WGA-EpuloA1]
MLTVERRKEILELLNKKGSVNVIELAEQYDLGKETIRRDLKALAQDWNISLVYGGASIKSALHPTSIKEQTIIQKREENAELKHKIAKAAVELINIGDIIAMNSGSTVEYMLNYIENKVPLSIITTSINIASKASMISGVDIYIPSGKIRNKSGMVISSNAENYLRNFRVQKCFFGVSAVSLGSHITHPAVEEVENNRALLSISEKVYMVADSSKFDKKSLYQLAKLGEMSGIITDKMLDEAYEMYFKNYRIKA